MAQTGTMRIAVKGKNLDVTNALRDYADKKVRKLVKFFREGEAFADVVLSVQRELHIAEVTVQLGGLILRGESRTPDMYASIDAASDRIERQLQKFKTRIQRRLQVTPKLGEAHVALLDAAGQNEEEAPTVVRSKRFSIKPMDVEEAITQMELIGHDFFVFNNAGTDEVNVVYKRRDGDYGLIEPS